MGIPDHFTCLLRNLYAGQEATEADMGQRTCSKLGKRYVKAIYCHPAYLTYCRVHHEKRCIGQITQAGIKMARRNINNLRYADDTTLMKSRNSMKRQKDMTWKDELPKCPVCYWRSVETWRNNSRNNEETEPKQK